MDTQEIMVPQVTSSKKADGAVKTKSLRESSLNSWQIVRLGEVCRNITLINPGAYPEKPFTYLDVSSVSNESYRIIETREILGKDAPSRARKLVQTDDVIFATVRPTLKRIAMIPSELNGQVCSTGFCVLRANRKNLEPLYLYFLLLTEFVNQRVESLQKGATYPAISDTDLFNLSIPLPSISEQNTIAQVLQTVQDAIQARRQELELGRECKAALMEHLFTQGTHGEITKQTEIGEIPESWEIVRLGELCAHNLGYIQTGPFGSQLHASDYKDQGIPVVNPTHLGINTIVEDSPPLVSEEDAERLSKHYLMEGDVLVSRRGDFSRYSYITSRQAGWLCGTGCLLIRLNNPKVDNQFFAISIGTENIQSYLANTATGSIMPNLNTKILEGLPLALPPTLDEQHQIVNVWSACTSKIIALEKELSLLEELFRALLEELMTGRLSTQPLSEKGGTHE